MAADARITVVDGGEDRSRSVLNALNFLTLRATAQDWVLVHDAVRPCVTSACIDRLCQRSVEHEVGAILGVPVSDTLKLVDAQKSIQDRKSTRLNSSHVAISYAVFCLTNKATT